MRRGEEFLDAVRRSRALHRPWVAPPDSPEAFAAYLKGSRARNALGYWILTGGGDIAGVVNVSEIVRGAFCSAYLGYYAFVPHEAPVT